MAEFTIWMRCIVEAATLSDAEDILSRTTEDVPAEMYFEEPPQLRTIRGALARADAEVVVLADALRAAGVPPHLVQKMIDEAKPR